MDIPRYWSSKAAHSLSYKVVLASLFLALTQVWHNSLLSKQNDDPVSVDSLAGDKTFDLDSVDVLDRSIIVYMESRYNIMLDYYLPKLVVILLV